MSSTWIGLVVVALGLAVDGPGDSKVRPQYETLLKAYEADVRAWEAKYPPAGKDVDLVARYRDWPGWAYAPRVLAFAEANPDDPSAVDALLWVAGLRDAVGTDDRGVRPYYERAVGRLGGHLKDPRIDFKTYRVISRGLSTGSEEFLRRAATEGRDRDARGCALVGLADCLRVRAETVRDPWYERAATPFLRYTAGRFDADFLAYFRGADPAALADEATRLYREAIRDYGDVIATPAGDTVAMLAKAALLEMAALSVGRVFPEVEGPDASGERLSLREHRGKVVIVAMSHAGSEVNGQLRDLLAKHKGEPFAVLGISLDPKKGALDASIKAGDVIWPTWWHGKDSPIFKGLKCRNVPPLFVLDAEGVIQSRGHSADGFVEVVDRLLAERKGKP